MKSLCPPIYWHACNSEMPELVKTNEVHFKNRRSFGRLAVFSLVALVSVLLCRTGYAQTNQWTWMGGNSNKNVFMQGVYGTLGLPAVTNIPGARQLSSTWTDSSGNLWLFGGLGLDANGSAPSYMNDLWRFDPSTNEWTWMSGSDTVGTIANCAVLGGCGRPGVYGVLGKPGAGNIPGGRQGAASWTDSKGNFWLFGGNGYDSAGTLAYLNDLWEFNPSSNQWTWMGGPDAVTGTCFGDAAHHCGGPSGVYGTLGTFAATNLPGGRQKATTWVDSSGNFWLFGGYQLNNTVRIGGNYIQYDFNDLWKFNPSTNQWAWMSGSSTLGEDCVWDPDSYFYMCGQAGTYGSIGGPAASSMPGSRDGAIGWIDKSDNLWLVGGTAFDASANYNPLNDVWKFNPSTNYWAWMGGSSNAPGCLANWGNYCAESTFGTNGTLGIPSADNIPGFMAMAAAWTDKSGNFWVFGGTGDEFFWGWNDMWEFAPSANEWTWMNGSIADNPFGTPGVYGTLGTPASGNYPGSRYGAATWTDNSGHFWLFGGYGFQYIWLSDLWEYQPSAPSPVPSFAVTAIPGAGGNDASVTVTEGESGAMTVRVSVSDGFNSAVALAVGNLPSGVIANLSPALITGLGTSQVAFSVGMGAAPGKYTINVTGTSQGVTKTTPIYLTVAATPIPFTLNVSPTALTVNSGGQGTAVLTVTPRFGFNTTVSFSCSGLPYFTACSFSPTTITLSGTAATTQLTISKSSNGATLRRWPRQVFPFAVLTMGLCIFGGRGRQRILRLLLVAAACVGFGLAVSCGGGGSGTGQSLPLMSTVTITVSNGVVQQSTQLSLETN